MGKWMLFIFMAVLFLGISIAIPIVFGYSTNMRINKKYVLTLFSIQRFIMILVILYSVLYKSIITMVIGLIILCFIDIIFSISVTKDVSKKTVAYVSVMCGFLVPCVLTIACFKIV